MQMCSRFLQAEVSVNETLFQDMSIIAIAPQNPPYGP